MNTSKEKMFTVTLMNKCPTYEVTGSQSTSLDAVWDSQKHWFMPGTTVLIADGAGNSKLFVKENEIAVR